MAGKSFRGEKGGQSEICFRLSRGRECAGDQSRDACGPPRHGGAHAADGGHAHDSRQALLPTTCNHSEPRAGIQGLTRPTQEHGACVHEGQPPSHRITRQTHCALHQGLPSSLTKYRPDKRVVDWQCTLHCELWLSRMEIGSRDPAEMCVFGCITTGRAPFSAAGGSVASLQVLQQLRSLWPSNAGAVEA